MGRSPCCSKVGLNRGTWTAAEDRILIDYINIHGEGRWRNLPKRAGLKRCGKSCRLRWLNYLRPDIKRGNITSDEEDLIIRLHKLLGNRWSLIAGRLAGRTDNEIKNYWNTTLRKKVHNHHSSSSASTPKKNIQKNIAEPLQQNIKHQVVRTKAVSMRCTKDLTSSRPQETEPAGSNTNPINEESVPKDQSITSNTKDHSGVNSGASSSSHESSCPQDFKIQNVIVDNSKDIFQSDLDFSGLFNSNQWDNEIINRPLVDMLEDYWTAGDYLQPNVASMDQYFASAFHESGVSWLA